MDIRRELRQLHHRGADRGRLDAGDESIHVGRHAQGRARVEYARMVRHSCRACRRPQQSWVRKMVRRTHRPSDRRAVADRRYADPGYSVLRVPLHVRERDRPRNRGAAGDAGSRRHRSGPAESAVRAAAVPDTRHHGHHYALRNWPESSLLRERLHAVC